MLYPHDREAFRALRPRARGDPRRRGEAARSSRPRSRDALYGAADAPRDRRQARRATAPRCCPPSPSSTPTRSRCARGRAPRRRGRGSTPSRARVARDRGAPRHDPAAPLPTLARTPFFCSGCPHNTSTANPDGHAASAPASAATRWSCSRPRARATITGITQMGGEGAQLDRAWRRSPTADHFVQNLGDGTFHHSGSLAIRFAVAAGRQRHLQAALQRRRRDDRRPGRRRPADVPELTRWLALEGVKRIIVTTEDPERYSGVTLDPIAAVRHRDELAEAQARARRDPGRDRADPRPGVRRRDAPPAQARQGSPTPPQRILINERVCEGCGDCGAKSNCLSVLPVETEFGRKTQIHQASCNKDYSCLKGDCPSFLTVVPGKARGRAKRVDPAAAGRAARARAAASRATTSWCACPASAAPASSPSRRSCRWPRMLDGKHACGLDQTGLAQKGGPVVSDVRIAARPDRGLQQGVGRRGRPAASASTCSAPPTPRTCSSPTRSARSRSCQHARGADRRRWSPTPASRFPRARAHVRGDRAGHARATTTSTSTRRRSPRRCSATTCRPTSLLSAPPTSRLRCR